MNIPELTIAHEISQVGLEKNVHIKLTQTYTDSVAGKIYFLFKIFARLFLKLTTADSKV